MTNLTTQNTQTQTITSTDLALFAKQINHELYQVRGIQLPLAITQPDVIVGQPKQMVSMTERAVQLFLELDENEIPVVRIWVKNQDNWWNYQNVLVDLGDVPEHLVDGIIQAGRYASLKDAFVGLTTVEASQWLYGEVFTRFVALNKGKDVNRLRAVNNHAFKIFLNHGIECWIGTVASAFVIRFKQNGQLLLDEPELQEVTVEHLTEAREAVEKLLDVLHDSLWVYDRPKN